MFPPSNNDLYANENRREFRAKLLARTGIAAAIAVVVGGGIYAYRKSKGSEKGSRISGESYTATEEKGIGMEAIAGTPGQSKTYKKTKYSCVRYVCGKTQLQECT